jgi:hypothetical protein
MITRLVLSALVVLGIAEAFTAAAADLPDSLDGLVARVAPPERAELQADPLPALALRLGDAVTPAALEAAGFRRGPESMKPGERGDEGWVRASGTIDAQLLIRDGVVRAVGYVLPYAQACGDLPTKWRKVLSARFDSPDATGTGRRIVWTDRTLGRALALGYEEKSGGCAILLMLLTVDGSAPPG